MFNDKCAGDLWLKWHFECDCGRYIQFDFKYTGREAIEKAREEGWSISKSGFCGCPDHRWCEDDYGRTDLSPKAA